MTLKNRPIFADLPTPIGYIKAVIFSWACARARCEFGPESANLRRFGVNGDNRSPRTPRICARSCTCLGRIPRHAARRAGLSPFSMHGRSEAEEPVLSEDVALIICADYRPARVFDSPPSAAFWHHASSAVMLGRTVSALARNCNDYKQVPSFW